MKGVKGAHKFTGFLKNMQLSTTQQAYDISMTSY